MAASPGQHHGDTVVLTISGTILATTSGEWCDDCLLPSAVRHDVALELAGKPLMLVQALRCEHCGHHEVTRT